jgi:hypothetical protein
VGPHIKGRTYIEGAEENMRKYPKVSGLAAWSETANGTALCH